MKRTNTAKKTTTADHAMGIVAIDVHSIAVPERKRQTTEDAIELLMKSMQEVGHLVPIAIRFVSSTDDAGVAQHIPTLVAGAHRLGAAKRLGWQTINCMVIEGDLVSAELAEIVENLHRTGLTKAERDEHIRRYAELLKQGQGQSGQIVLFESQRDDGRGHRKKGTSAIIAEKTGLSKKTVDRALKGASDGEEPAEPPKAKRKTPSETARTRLQKAWGKADEADRQWFLEWATET